MAAGDPQWDYAISPKGSLFWRPAGTQDWYSWGNLNAIVVTAIGTFDEPPVFDYNNYSLIPPNSGGSGSGISRSQ